MSQTPPNNQNMSVTGLNHKVWIGFLAGIGAAMLWGIWPTISRFSVQSSLNPYDIVFIRFAVSGLLLLPIFLKYRFKDISVTGAGLLMSGAGAPYVIITVIGLQYTPASHGGLVIPSFNIIFSTVGAALFLGTKPTIARLTGLAFILVGCGTIFAQGIANADTVVLFGNLFFVLGGFAYAVYTVSSQKYRLDPWHAASIVSVLSALIYIPIYLIFLPSNLGDGTLEDIITQAFFQGIFTSIIAIFCFSTAIAKLGAARAVVFVALMPVFTMMTAIPILGEWPTLLEAVALGIIVMGTFIAVELFQQIRNGMGRK